MSIMRHFPVQNNVFIVHIAITNVNEPPRMSYVYMAFACLSVCLSVSNLTLDSHRIIIKILTQAIEIFGNVSNFLRHLVPWPSVTYR